MIDDIVYARPDADQAGRILKEIDERPRMGCKTLGRLSNEYMNYGTSK
jgi:hypothetical protein